ncbi:MAG: hypothetical protein ACLRW2_03995 [Parasutterella excrementihominis]
MKHYQRIGDVSLGVDYQRSPITTTYRISTTIRESSENILNQNFWLTTDRLIEYVYRRL